MSNRPTAKKIFRALGKLPRVGAHARQTDPRPTALDKKLSKVVARCVQQAFTDAGRDIDRDEDWGAVTIWLAISVYAGRDGSGRPAIWSARKQSRLIDDVDRIKLVLGEKRLPATDLDCCRELIKRPPYSKMKGKRYLPLTPSGLRSSLTRARRAKNALQIVGMPSPTGV